METIDLGSIHAIDDNYKVSFLMHNIDLAEMKSRIFEDTPQDIKLGFDEKDCRKCKMFSTRQPVPDFKKHMWVEFVLKNLCFVFESFAKSDEPVPVELANTYIYLCSQIGNCEPMTTRIPMYVGKYDGAKELRISMGNFEVLVNYLDS